VCVSLVRKGGIMEEQSDFMTSYEAANFLKIKRNTLYTWAYRRQIPSQKIGGALRFDRIELERWLQAQKRGVELE